MATVARRTARRNEGGRYSAHSTWYAQVEAEHLARIEAMAAQAAVAKLARVVGDAACALPEAASRLTKAATLVQHKEVWPMTDGTFLVGSQSDTEKAYLVRRHPTWRCDCADHTRHGTPFCKHILAVCLTVKMGTAYQATYN